MRIKTIILLSLAVILPITARAQNISPTATHLDKDGSEVVEEGSFDGDAPLEVTFRANPSDMDDFSPIYEWHFRREGEEKDLLVRYEEDTKFIFTDAGTTHVTLIVKLNSQGDELISNPISITISESKLTFPNAFSPNGDEWNETFKPKECQSIVEFHAYIFNRWGQKLYDWTDPFAEGWDGRYNGKDVKEGVYFLLVKAKGADGRVYNIRKDVNLLREYDKEFRNE